MGSLSHSEQLRLKIKLVEPRAEAVAHAFWTHPRLGEMFPDFLFMVHSSMRASVPLMESAEQRARSMADADPVAAGLARYLTKHIREEQDHDEWLLEDMVAIGIDRSEALSRVPSPAVASLVGAQYYWVLHAHPVAVLGFLAVLEGNPPSAEQLAEVQARHGIPHEAFRTLLKHADLDPHHRDELYAAIDGLPLTSQQSALLAMSSFHTIDQVSCAFEEIMDSHKSSSG